MSQTRKAQAPQALLLEHDLFAECSPGFVDRIRAQSQVISAGKGQVLFVHEERADRFYMVLSGWVKLFRETPDGAQAVIDILSEGHIFGETSIFQDDAYPCSAEAAEPSEFFSMPIALLKAEIETNPKMALAMLTSMAHYRKQQDQELEHRTLQNAPQRIGCFLLRLADQQAEGPVSIQLPYDKTLVASRLGMQPETFSRALGKLKDSTDIAIKGSVIEVEDLGQLAEFSCSACSSEFPCADLHTKGKACGKK